MCVCSKSAYFGSDLLLNFGMSRDVGYHSECAGVTCGSRDTGSCALSMIFTGMFLPGSEDETWTLVASFLFFRPAFANTFTSRLSGATYPNL